MRTCTVWRPLQPLAWQAQDGGAGPGAHAWVQRCEETCPLICPQVAAAANAITCASWGAEGDPRECLRSAMWVCCLAWQAISACCLAALLVTMLWQAPTNQCPPPSFSCSWLFRSSLNNRQWLPHLYSGSCGSTGSSTSGAAAQPGQVSQQGQRQEQETQETTLRGRSSRAGDSGGESGAAAAAAEGGGGGGGAGWQQLLQRRWPQAKAVHFEHLGLDIDLERDAAILWVVVGADVDGTPCACGSVHKACAGTYIHDYTSGAGACIGWWAWDRGCMYWACDVVAPHPMLLLTHPVSPPPCTMAARRERLAPLWAAAAAPADRYSQGIITRRMQG